MAAVDFVLYDIFTADAPAIPGDPSWTAQPHLVVGTLTRGVSPTLSQASLTWQFGEMSRGHNDSPDTAMAYVAPLDLQGKYVLIDCDELGINWIGFIPDHAVVDWSYEEVEEVYRPTGGTQNYTAFGLEYFLGRTQVSGTSSREADRSKRPYSYNSGSGDGRDLDQAKRGNREPPTDDPTDALDPGVNDAYDPLTFSFEKDAIEWRADAIVKHLLKEQCPRDDADAPAPVEYFLEEGAIPYLRWYKPTVKVEGRTLLQILDDIIDRRRGLAWWLETGVIGEDPDQELVAYIRVTSANPGDTTLPPEYDPPEDPLPTVPANDSPETLDDPSIYPTLAPIPIKYNGPRKYHRVRVRGARRTTTFSAIGAGVISGVGSYVFAEDIDSRIEAAWSTEDATDYLAGVSLIDPDYATYTEEQKQDKNDRYRQTPKFERVFRFFSINLDGDLQPIIQPETGSIVGWFQPERRVSRVSRATAMKVGFDYDDATAPTANGDIANGEEFVRPFTLVYLPRGIGFQPITLGEIVLDPGNPTTSTDGGWRRAEELSTHEEVGFTPGDETDVTTTRELKVNFAMRPLVGEPGFVMQVHGGGGMAHMLAATEDLEDLEPSKYAGGVSWGGLLVTATSESDCYCEAVWPTTIPEAAPIEELLVQIGERARYDYLAKGTVYDLDDHGVPKQVGTGGALRDDRKLCEQVAQLAYQWYGTERATVALSFASLEEPFGLGVLLTTIGQGAAQRTVNSLVTQITHDMHQGRSTIQCGFGELDFTGFA